MASDDTAAVLLSRLRAAGLVLWEKDGELHYRAPEGSLTPADLKSLRAAKSVLLTQLLAERHEFILLENTAERYQPFPLTDMQATYLSGRENVYGYGGIGCHIYLEVTYPDLVASRAENVWNQLIARHDMLRVVMEPSDSQRILSKVPFFAIPCGDMRNHTATQAQTGLDRIRSELSHKKYDPQQWPLFEIRISRTAEYSVLHLSMDLLMADWSSICLLLAEFEGQYAQPDKVLVPINVTFRDYLLAERKLRGSPKYIRDRQYWLQRLADFPSAPELPRADYLPQPESARFRRRYLRLDNEDWLDLKQHATAHGLTPTSIVLTAFCAVIARWSLNKKFCLSLTVLNRLATYPQIEQVVGDFTSVSLFPVDWQSDNSFVQQAKAISAQLFTHLDHRLFSGAEVLRELVRQKGREAALMPVVFTSAIGLRDYNSLLSSDGRLDGRGITQAPQVFINCQAADDAHGLQINWDIREGIYPMGMTDDMFDVFSELLLGLVDSVGLWRQKHPLPLPAWQRKERQKANSTMMKITSKLLHQAIFQQAERTPGAAAVIDSQQSVSYGELTERARAVANRLQLLGCRSGECVAVVMNKGAEQISALLGIFSVGAVYVPIDVGQPEVRRFFILKDAGCRLVLTTSKITMRWPTELKRVDIDRLKSQCHDIIVPTITSESPAYVIYTSGSSGRPKGVTVSHRSALNTILDINRKFKVSSQDRVLGLAHLDFDLSIYDALGLLSVGGSLVYPPSHCASASDPAHWVELMHKHGITLWNTVPAMIQILETYLTSMPPIRMPAWRLALVSGDWVRPGLPDALKARFPQLQLVVLGGATEAAIWSNYHCYQGAQPGWRSIPYGFPLANQRLHVLDENTHDCPVWSKGEIYIGGDGVAIGYIGDEFTTSQRFITHKETHSRLFRSGDFGRYLPGGEIEFLGREDCQTKINGQRIELGEIESVLCQHPGVAAAGVAISEFEGHISLFAAVETRQSTVQSDPIQINLNLKRRNRLEFRSKHISYEYTASQVVAALASLNEAMLDSMLSALLQLGLFALNDRENTEQWIGDSAISPDFYWLIERWFAVLLSEKWLLKAADGSVMLTNRINQNEGHRRWREAECLWNNVLASSEFLGYLKRCADSLPALLKGALDAKKLLLPQGDMAVVQALYCENMMAQYLNDTVSHLIGNIASDRLSNRRLRILEIGAGSGSMTQAVLSILRSYSVDYRFTDISTFFLSEARANFGNFPDISFIPFDIEQDYRSQGLQPNGFDIVLVDGVLGNISHQEEALCQLIELAAPGACLVLVESTQEYPWILASQAFMMKTSADLTRSKAAYLSRNDWLTRLAHYTDGEVICLPESSHPLFSLGQHIFAVRLKTQRAYLTVTQVRAFLRMRLPDYMIPEQWQIVDKLPLTANSKLDRKQLRQWQMAAWQHYQRQPTTSDNANLLNNKLAEMWRDALGVTQLTQSQNLYEMGADSLIMARMARRMREQLKGAPYGVDEVPFDALLYLMLNQPTIEALAEYIWHYPKMSAMNISHHHHAMGEENAKPFGSNGIFYHYGGGKTDVTRIVFHAGLGSMDGFQPLLTEMAEQSVGAVIGISVDDDKKYCALDSERLVELVADDYATFLLAAGYQQCQLLGYCLGGLYAVEVARRLKDRGVNILDLVLVSSHPVRFDVHDELMIEMLFLPNLSISIEQLELGAINSNLLVQGFMQVIEANNGIIPIDSLGAIGNGGELDQVGELFRTLNTKTQHQRFECYVAAQARHVGQAMSVEKAMELFTVFRQSFLSGRFTPTPYLGDIRFLLPQQGYDFAPGIDSQTLAFWREICLGTMKVTHIEGNHFSCIAAENVESLARLIALPFQK
ncbi:pyochelin synthetase [Yersinia nurmii]|uniref:Pyochelin synthetase n=1 Tax=Yersinia nurmii TaxID=685706 RepID=A0ABM9S7K3_9GAMM|nr:non-ribosomal peptide synthetase [Yersinia nurmii]CNE41306.1 pyochelin synthetase [Yersinia nurmii]